MARAPNSPSRANLSAEAARQAVPRLETRIRELRDLDLTKIQSADDPTIRDVEARIKSTLASIYGEQTAEYRRLVDAADLDLTVYVMAIFEGSPGTSVQAIREGVDRGRHRANSLLAGEVTALKERPDYADAPSAAMAARPQAERSVTDEVFIVHGQDTAAKVELARFIEHAGLKAIILHEQANAGRTINEKFEDHGGSAGFAVVLLTPDDVGGRDAGNLKPRARQNVIGEMFWFAGKLGRKRVCALKKGDLEIPSDFAGVVYTEMDERGAWKQELLRELGAAGYKVDWQKALG
jgi:predicted nucleotide-binding protein